MSRQAKPPAPPTSQSIDPASKVGQAVSPAVPNAKTNGFPKTPVVFSVLIGNGDMHLKNWSLLFPDGRTPALSPAYDFVATFLYVAGDKLALSFGGSRSLNDITMDQVRRFADRARLQVSPIWRIVSEIVERTAAAWKVLDQKKLLPAEMSNAIDMQIGRDA